MLLKSGVWRLGLKGSAYIFVACEMHASLVQEACIWHERCMLLINKVYAFPKLGFRNLPPILHTTVSC